MLKSKVLSISLLTTSVLALAGCSLLQKDTSDSNTDKTEQSSVKSNDEKIQDKAKKDASTLLSAILTENDNGFSRLYGDNYSTWSDDVNANGAKDRVEELGLSPEEKWTITYYDAPLTPTELISNFLETRRNLIQKIDEFSVTDVVVEDDETVTVTASLYGIDSLEMAQMTRDLKGKVLSDDYTLWVAESDSEDLDKLDILLNFYLVDGLYGNKFLGLGVPHAGVPLTQDEIEIEFTLRKNSDSRWVISEEDYRSLISDLMVADNGVDSTSTSDDDA